METTNTYIATNKTGIFIDFKGSRFANPVYIKITGSKIEATYNRKDSGFADEKPFLLGKEVRKATNQKWINGHPCELKQTNYTSPMELLSNVTGMNYNGSLLDNALIY